MLGPGGRSPPKIIKERGPSEPAVVALRMEDLTVWTSECVAKMPRSHKFTIGDKLEEACLQVTTLLVHASFVHDKADLLRSASLQLVRARVLIRIAQRLHLVSTAQRLWFAEQTLEIGKMIGGWTRAVKAR